MLNRGLSVKLSAAMCAAMLGLAACSGEVEGAAEGVEQTNATLTSALSSAEDLDTLTRALSSSGLASVFDGAGSYTVLAPVDGAFEALGDRSDALLSDAQQPILIATLRNHVLPGSFDIDAIRQAIQDKGGPVEMTTLGSGIATFALDGETLTASIDGDPVAIDPDGVVIATNGVLIPVDALVSQPPAPQTAQ